MVQQIMSNPEIMRQMMLSNPQMRELMEVSFLSWKSLLDVASLGGIDVALDAVEYQTCLAHFAILTFSRCYFKFFRHASYTPFRVHRVLEKTLKVLEF